MDTDLCGCLDPQLLPEYAPNRTLLQCRAMNVTSSTTPLPTAAVQPAPGTSPWMYAVIGVGTVFIIAVAAALYNSCELFRTGPRPRRKTAAAGKPGPSALSTPLPTPRLVGASLPVVSGQSMTSQQTMMMMQMYPGPPGRPFPPAPRDVTYQNVTSANRTLTAYECSPLASGPGSAGGSGGGGGGGVEVEVMAKRGCSTGEQQTPRKVCGGGEESEQLLPRPPYATHPPPPPPPPPPLHPAQMTTHAGEPTSGLPRSHNRRYQPAWESHGTGHDPRRKKKGGGGGGGGSGGGGFLSACFSRKSRGHGQEDEDEEEEEEVESEVRFRQKLYTHVRSVPPGRLGSGEDWGTGGGGVYRTSVEVHANRSLPGHNNGGGPAADHSHSKASSRPELSSQEEDGEMLYAPGLGSRLSVPRQPGGAHTTKPSPSSPHSPTSSSSNPLQEEYMLATRPAALWSPEQNPPNWADTYHSSLPHAGGPPPPPPPHVPSPTDPSSLLPHHPHHHQPAMYTPHPSFPTTTITTTTATPTHISGKGERPAMDGGGGRFLPAVAEDSYAEADDTGSASSFPQQSPPEERRRSSSPQCHHHGHPPPPPSSQDGTSTSSSALLTGNQ
ncbi:uncharacterized protein LOC143290311 [Babylonia areolata]|uniref:uncharacterized protein LOC143290311 n=1 Tax=Babylonia areolata TaxID=304850 RepID=UPI003FD12980